MEVDKNTNLVDNYDQIGGNIIIGKNAGKYLILESLCVIVGHDSLAINAKGKDMIWQVDWNEPYLTSNPDIKSILENYYKCFILTKKDNKKHRRDLLFRVINRNNTNTE